MRTEAASELADALDRRLAALAHDVCRTELTRERDAILVTAQHDDSLGTEASRCDDAAQTDGAVTHAVRRWAATSNAVRSQLYVRAWSNVRRIDAMDVTATLRRSWGRLWRK